MNVALTLAPFLSGTDHVLDLLRRWVRREPAAFVGGLVYGFSPFVITELALTQLNIAFLAIPPLVVLLLDELLVRQEALGLPHRSVPGPAPRCFSSSWSAPKSSSSPFCSATSSWCPSHRRLRRPPPTWRSPSEHARHALRGIAHSPLGPLSLVLLAYPLWFLLRGPSHLSGPIWSNGSVSQYGNTLTSFWKAAATSGCFGSGHDPLRRLPGPGATRARISRIGRRGGRSRRPVCSGVTIAASCCSVASEWRRLFSRSVPDTVIGCRGRPVESVPWIGDIVEIRFTVVLSLCAAVMVAIVIDRLRRPCFVVHHPCSGRPLGPRSWPASSPWPWWYPPSSLWWRRRCPSPPRPSSFPRGFPGDGKDSACGSRGSRLPGSLFRSSVIAGLAGLGHPMRWAQAGGGGPQGQPSWAGTVRPGFDVLVRASLPLGPAPPPTTANLVAVRLCAPGPVASHDDRRPRSGDVAPLRTGEEQCPYAVAFFTAAMGRPPAYVDSAWVWSAVSRSGGPPSAVTTTAFDACVARSSTTVLRACKRYRPAFSDLLPEQGRRRFSGQWWLTHGRPVGGAPWAPGRCRHPRSYGRRRRSASPFRRWWS